MTKKSLKCTLRNWSRNRSVDVVFAINCLLVVGLVSLDDNSTSVLFIEFWEQQVILFVNFASYKDNKYCGNRLTSLLRPICIFIKA